MASTVGLAVREDRSPLWSAGLAFLAGSALGGCSLGLVAVGVAEVTRPWGGDIVALSVAAGILWMSLLESTPWGRRPPSLSRQVSREIPRRLGKLVGSWLWGLELGVGLATRVNSWLVLALPLAIVLTPWNLGLFAGVTYGGVRGVQPLVTMTSQNSARCESTRLVSHLAGLLALLGSCSFGVVIAARGPG